MNEQEIPYWLDFKGIAASVHMALERASQARLTGDLLRLAAFSARTMSSDVGCQCDDLRNQLVEIDEEHLHSLGRELRRSTLITAIGILDFCLFETLVFMVSIRADVLERLPKELRRGGDPLNAAKESLKRTSIKKRLDLVEEILQVSVAGDLRVELGPLLEKRHTITHQSKFYETVPHGNTTITRARAFPEVTYEESTIALMNITEIADSVLVGVSRDYFDADLGDLRPLNSAVAAFNRAMREKILEERARGPVIEEIEDSGWSVVVRDSWVFAADEHLNITFAPMGFDHLPVSVFCPKHTVHGEVAYLTIDDGEREEIGFMNASFLARLLAGKSLLLEYQVYSSDVPLFIRLSLHGFPEKWTEAQARKAAQPD